MTVTNQGVLEREIAQLVVTTLKRAGLTAIAPGTPLFGAGIELDSIEAVALAQALQERYGVIVTADAEGARRHFTSVASLAAFVAANREPCANS